MKQMSILIAIALVSCGEPVDEAKEKKYREMDSAFTAEQKKIDSLQEVREEAQKYLDEH